MLYLCMQTRLVNRNQTARGFVLTWPGLLIAFVTVTFRVRYLKCNHVLRITENCYARQRKRRARSIGRFSAQKNAEVYPPLLFCRHCRRCISRSWTSRNTFLYPPNGTSLHLSSVLYCNTNLLYPRHIFGFRQSRNKILENNLHDLTYLFQLREYYLLKFFLLLFIAKHKSQRATQSNFL